MPFAELQQFHEQQSLLDPKPDDDRGIDADQVSRFINLLKKDPEKTRVRGFAHKANPNKAASSSIRTLNLKNLKPQEKWQAEGRGSIG